MLFVRSVLLLALEMAVTSAEQKHAKIQHAASSCSDIRLLNTKNATLQSGSRVFRFRSGTAVNYDDPPPGVNDPKPDWIAEIEQDQVVQPEVGVELRFVMIHDSHETGSGWRYYLSGFQCSGGRLREVFHRDGMSLSIDEMSTHVSAFPY